MRIAMWSGPRNLSTALMYAFAARGDCAVWDEPFYACYLRATGLAHPMATEIMAADGRNPAEIVHDLRADPPEGARITYQKHMCQHMIDGMPRDWMSDVVNVFLIRNPDRVLASFGAKYADVTLQDIGFVQQAEIFESVFHENNGIAGNPGGVSLSSESGFQQAKNAPLVIDSADIRADPDGMMRALCKALGLDYRPEMLNWPAGPKPYDGVWAPVWYEAVHRSTGFAGAEGPLPELPAPLRAISDAALPHYGRLARYKLAP